MWVRAVWLEGKKEEEGVLPKVWLRNGCIHWPPGVDASKALQEMREPAANWQKFKLVKVQMTSSE